MAHRRLDASSGGGWTSLDGDCPAHEPAWTDDCREHRQAPAVETHRGGALRNRRGRGRLALDRKLSFPDAPADRVLADVAQLAEQPPRKWQVVSSNLTVGSIKMPLWL